MQILIVHAGDAERRGMRSRLEASGAQVREAATAERALEAIDGWSPEVALVSVELCRRDATDLLSEVKAHRSTWATAVVLLAPEFDADDVARQIARGAHDVLREPVDPGELRARVEAAARTKRLQEELLAQSRRMEAQLLEDFLTGVANRRFIFAQLDALLSAARRHHRPLSVLMIDIDHFKAVNDTHGHDAGDRVLTAVAHAIRDRVRAEDHVGRIGGEEFLVLLPDAGGPEAARVAEDVRRRIAEVAVEVRGATIHTTASVGCASTDASPQETVEGLLRRADNALYAAKSEGRDAVREG